MFYHLNFVFKLFCWWKNKKDERDIVDKSSKSSIELFNDEEEVKNVDIVQ